MIQRTAVATLGALLLIASSGVAWAIPTTLTVQGHLTNAAGQAADGDYVLRLSLYDAPAGGDTVWTQLYEVDVADGVFDAALGDDPLNPLQADTFVNANQLWLGIQVSSGPGVPDGGDAELPRGPLTTVGYAFAAQHAATADNATTATTATTADSATTATTAATADVANALDCNACVGTVQLAFDPATQTELDLALANIQFPTSV
ncbi:MAG: hypothetical protein VX938_03425, partial [Myxococcota bacterium]|nr:hypothetical protein [Myxococcota bacterium]